jgi:hypothetical protein
MPLLCSYRNDYPFRLPRLAAIQTQGLLYSSSRRKGAQFLIAATFVAQQGLIMVVLLPFLPKIWPYSLDITTFRLERVCRVLIQSEKSAIPYLFRSYGSANIPLTKARADEFSMNFRPISMNFRPISMNIRPHASEACEDYESKEMTSGAVHCHGTRVSFSSSPQDHARRKELWAYATFSGSPKDTKTVKAPRMFMEDLCDALCYAA